MTKPTKELGIRPTRFPELGYRKDGAVWRIYDRREETGAVGPCYASKAELFGDLDRYAAEFGCPLAMKEKEVDRGVGGGLAVLKTRDYEHDNAMDPEEFQALGLLQELNRLFLHPRGLALAVTIEEGPYMRLGPIYDYRDEPEGIEFARGEIDEEKVTTVWKMRQDRFKARIALPEMGADGVQKLDSEWSPEEVE